MGNTGLFPYRGFEIMSILTCIIAGVCAPMTRHPTPPMVHASIIGVVWTEGYATDGDSYEVAIFARTVPCLLSLDWS